MAAIFARRPILTTTVATAAVGTALYMARPAPLRLESAFKEPSKTLSFPRTMLFSRELQVKQVEQVNHDTKRITFNLPGGDSEISGVPASCKYTTLASTKHSKLTPHSRHPNPAHRARSLVPDPAPLHADLLTR